jgi:hypothetical protein
VISHFVNERQKLEKHTEHRDMNKETTTRTSISSIRVVEPTPQLAIKLAKPDAGLPTIIVNGMTLPQAAETDWGKLFDIVMRGLGELLSGNLGGGGSGSGGGGCVTITITNSDGSITTITQCPPPKGD